MKKIALLFACASLTACNTQNVKTNTEEPVARLNSAENNGIEYSAEQCAGYFQYYVEVPENTDTAEDINEKYAVLLAAYAFIKSESEVTGTSFEKVSTRAARYETVLRKLEEKAKEDPVALQKYYQYTDDLKDVCTKSKTKIQRVADSMNISDMADMTQYTVCNAAYDVGKKITKESTVDTYEAIIQVFEALFEFVETSDDFTKVERDHFENYIPYSRELYYGLIGQKIVDILDADGNNMDEVADYYLDFVEVQCSDEKIPLWTKMKDALLES